MGMPPISRPASASTPRRRQFDQRGGDLLEQIGVGLEEVLVEYSVLRAPERSRKSPVMCAVA